MKLSVNYNEVNRIGVLVGNKSNELETKIKEIMKLIAELNKYWEGPDYNTFYDNSISYLESKKTELAELRRISYLMCKASSKYSSKDVEWGNHMRKEGLEDESKR